MNIALLGPSGVGKGTHAGHLIARYNLRHLVTGELFRENVEKRSAVGILAKKYMARGELVPDEIVDAMVEAWLWQADPAQGILFDGFPRTVDQAKYLDALFPELRRTLTAVLYLNISEAELNRRLAGRVICRRCQTPYHLELNPPAQPATCDRCAGELIGRPDDIPEMIRVRLRAFNRETGPLLAYYQAQGKLLLIDGQAEIGQVQAEITNRLAAAARHEFWPASLVGLPWLEAFQESPFPSLYRIEPPRLNLVLLGGPGSGKGTQAEQLRAQLNLCHISTGDLFRDHLKHQTDLGKLAKTYMDQGQLVPDDVTEAMVEARLAQLETQAGFVLDGFPRTLPQAKSLSEIMANLQRRIAGVLYIKVSDSEIVSRLSGRRICRNCQTPVHIRFNPPRQPDRCDLCGGELYQRDDDNPDTIRTRLKTFHSQISPLLNYYQDAGLLIEIDGEDQVDQVTARTLVAARRLAKAFAGAG